MPMRIFLHLLCLVLITAVGCGDSDTPDGEPGQTVSDTGEDMASDDAGEASPDAPDAYIDQDIYRGLRLGQRRCSSGD